MILAAWYHGILATLFAFLAVILMAVILLQRGKGVGLAGAFGGAGGHTAFGAKTGDVLTWATIITAVVLLAFAVILNYIFVPPTPFASPAATPAPITVPVDDATTDDAEIPAETPAATDDAAAPAAPAEVPTDTPPAEPTPAESTPPAGGGDAPLGT